MVTLLRRLPPIARRDAEIARLQGQRRQLKRRGAEQGTLIEQLTADAEALRSELAARDRANAKLKTDLTDVRERLARRFVPSFRGRFMSDMRVRAMVRDVHGASYPIRAVNSKTTGYRFAESYGIQIPAQLAQYANPSEIDWSALPDAFVIKTVNGTSARGVLVLEKGPAGYVDLLADAPNPLTPAEIVADLEQKRQQKKVSASLGIEELIRSPSGQLLDVKLYCFYGTVGLIAVIARDTRHQLRFRHFWPDGTDAGDIRPDRPHDPELPAPVHLKDLVSAGEVLSAALPEPFVRLDFYEREDGIVFGEVTPRPGGKQIFRPDVDEHLGSLWEDAEAKLRAEAISAGIHEPRLSPR